MRIRAWTRLEIEETTPTGEDRSGIQSHDDRLVMFQSGKDETTLEGVYGLPLASAVMDLIAKAKPNEAIVIVKEEQ